MKDQTITNPESICEILEESSRLQYVLKAHFKILPDEISSIRVDGDNFKVDIETEKRSLRFKAKGTDSVLMTDPDSGGLKLEIDPALAQGIYNICT